MMASHSIPPRSYHHDFDDSGGGGGDESLGGLGGDGGRPAAPPGARAASSAAPTAAAAAATSLSLPRDADKARNDSDANVRNTHRRSMPVQPTSYSPPLHSFAQMVHSSQLPAEHNGLRFASATSSATPNWAHSLPQAAPTALSSRIAVDPKDFAWKRPSDPAVASAVVAAAAAAAAAPATARFHDVAIAKGAPETRRLHLAERAERPHADPFAPLGFIRPCSVISNHLLTRSSASDPYCYFEAHLPHLQPGALVSIGLVSAAFLETSMPGYSPVSVAFASDGTRCHSGRTSIACSPYHADGFGQGDVVGCAYRPVTGDVFFTLNGEYLGEAFSLKPRRTDGNTRMLHFHAAVGADAGCVAECNFGTAPFAYEPANEAGLSSSFSRAPEPARAAPVDTLHQPTAVRPRALSDAAAPLVPPPRTERSKSPLPRGTPIAPERVQVPIGPVPHPNGPSPLLLAQFPMRVGSSDSLLSANPPHRPPSPVKRTPSPSLPLPSTSAAAAAAPSPFSPPPRWAAYGSQGGSPPPSRDASPPSSLFASLPRPSAASASSSSSSRPSSPPTSSSSSFGILRTHASFESAQSTAAPYETQTLGRAAGSGRSRFQIVGTSSSSIGGGGGAQPTVQSSRSWGSDGAAAAAVPPAVKLDAAAVSGAAAPSFETQTLGRTGRGRFHIVTGSVAPAVAPAAAAAGARPEPTVQPSRSWGSDDQQASDKSRPTSPDAATAPATAWSPRALLAALPFAKAAASKAAAAASAAAAAAAGEGRPMEERDEDRLPAAAEAPRTSPAAASAAAAAPRTSPAANAHPLLEAAAAAVAAAGVADKSDDEIDLDALKREILLVFNERKKLSRKVHNSEGAASSVSVAAVGDEVFVEGLAGKVVTVFDDDGEVWGSDDEDEGEVDRVFKAMLERLETLEKKGT